jgi:branched-chain amino acid transport system permease protein
MSAVDTQTPPAAATGRRLGRGLQRREQIQLAIVVVLILFVLLALPQILSVYWVTVCTAVAYISVVSLGLNLLMGRVGLVSLGQIAVLAMGAWIASKLSFSTGLPFPIVLLLTGLLTMVLGTLVGLPALRLTSRRDGAARRP